MEQYLSQIGPIIVAVLSGIYVLFLPGLVLSFAFFPRKTVDVIERVAVSFALSIAVVPLVGFYLNMLGVKISRLNVLLEVAGIILVAGVAAYVMDRRARRVSGDSEENVVKTP
jgi:uncharacterized membrane protein